ncbi:LolA family protein [Psychroflexus planctonicus]|uniref:Membrane protein n=1 Tax=Psychroflexus planctonicus TaxID=1526575 RepID=A0ABQ1SES9_9FLAO|nr:outer membrane lipoprotein carrier protein LolA [Psychroflexus planctonicus]GGE28014.1 membrane protein [Psychroflexus planctonicus]
MKIKIILFSSFLLILSSITSVKAQSDPKAETLVNKVLQKVNSYENVVISFRYVLENTSEDIKQETRGDVTIEDEKYLLNLMGTKRIFDGEYIYTIIPEDEEVIISKYNEADESEITPSKMLTFFEDGYNFKMDIVQNDKGRKIQFVKLIPMDSDAEVKEIYLGIDEQTYHIHNLIQVQDNGTKTEIKVSSFKVNQPLSEILFQFNEEKYSNYYINRLD